MKKYLALSLVLVLALVVLAGCGAKKDEAPAAAPAAAATDAPAAEVAATEAPVAEVAAPAAEAGASVVGSWEMDMTEIAKAAGVDASQLPAICLEFTAEGKLNVVAAGQTVPAGDYTVEGSNIKMDAGAMGGMATGQTADVPFTIDGDKLTLAGTTVLTRK